MKYLAAFITFGFIGALHLGSETGHALPHSPPQNIDRPVHQATTTPGMSWRGNIHACFPLKTDKPEKRSLLSRRPACFTVDVGPGEATQIWLDQPVDLEVDLTGKTFQRRVDGFEFGVETLTIAEPGSYRIQIGKVDAAPGAVTFSIVRKKLEMQKASAWAQAEIWATTSKGTKKTEDIDTSLALWEDLGDTSSIARTYLKRGSALSRKSDPEGARIAFEKALELCAASFDTRCSAEAENNSGTMSSRLGDFNNAQQRFGEAIGNWRKLSDHLDEGATLSNLGLMFWQVGDFEQAIAFLNQAGELLRNRDTKRYGQALNNLGLCYQSLAEYERARGYFKGAARALERSKSLLELVRTRINLGRSYMLEGDLQRAQPILESAVAEADKLSNLQTRADALRNLAQNLWRMGQLEPARARLELALEVDRFDGDRRGQSSALHYLGLIAQKSGDTATARRLLTEAARLRHEIGLRDDATESLYELASLEYRAGHLAAARDSAEQALKLLESVRSQTPSPTLRASYYARKRQFFDLLVEIAMTAGNPTATADGLLASERGRSRALMDLLTSGSLLGALPEDMAVRHANNQRQLDYLSNLLSRTPPDKDIKLRLRFQKLLDDDEGLEDRIRRSLASQKLLQPLKSIEELQRELLSTGSALLEYHLGARQSYLWCVDAHQIQVFTLPPAATIESEAKPVVDGFGHILERRRSPSQRVAYNRTLKELSATLLGQLLTIHLPERLILVPDGVLHRVPLAALQLPGGVERLGLTHDLVQVPSATYLLVGAQPFPIQKFRQTILAVTDPVFSANDPRVTGNRSKSEAKPDTDLARLPFNYEIKTIESRVPRSRFRILSGFAASRVTLSHLRTEDFGVLHFSTHALIDDRIPERSWIALSRVDRAGHPVEDMGLLHPYQLAQLHLSSSIVVLSACDTALGKQVLGEGLMGFSSSLLYAGGSQLVLTLTEVDGEASSRFLSDVYRQYLPGNNSMEHSITIARRAMARSRHFSDPYYWASFIVIGRPTNTVNTGFAFMKDRK